MCGTLCQWHHEQKYQVHHKPAALFCSSLVKSESTLLCSEELKFKPNWCTHTCWTPKESETQLTASILEEDKKKAQKINHSIRFTIFSNLCQSPLFCSTELPSCQFTYLSKTTSKYLLCFYPLHYFSVNVDWFQTCLILPNVNTLLFSFKNIQTQIIFITPIDKVFKSAWSLIECKFPRKIFFKWQTLFYSNNERNLATYLLARWTESYEPEFHFIFFIVCVI